MEYFMTYIFPQIFELCLIPLMGIITTFLVLLIKTKMNEVIEKVDNDKADKYLQMLTETITDCVIATNQTYVETLKKQGKFDGEAQKVALQKTYESVMKVLTDDAKDYFTQSFGDVEELIKTKIETAVNTNK